LVSLGRSNAQFVPWDKQAHPLSLEGKGISV